MVKNHPLKNSENNLYPHSLTIPNAKIRVAVVGYGYLGKFHCQKVMNSPLAILTAIVESNQEKHHEISNLYQGVRIVSSVESVLDYIDAAIIVTPTSNHFDQIKKLLQQKKHIFVEKPICSNYDEVLRLQELYQTLSQKDRGRVLQVGHSERFSEAWDVLKSNERLKKIVETPGDTYFYRLAPFKERALDVDVIQDLMIHDLDLYLYLFKEMPQIIDVRGEKVVTLNWDIVDVRGVAASGRRVHFRVHRNYVKAVRSVEIINKEGTIVIDLNQSKIFYTLHSKKEGDIGEIELGKRDHLAIEHEAFYMAILNEGEIPVTLQDGVNTLKLFNDILSKIKSN